MVFEGEGGAVGKQEAITIVWVEIMVTWLRAVAVKMDLNLVISIHSLLLKFLQKENYIIE